MWKIVFQILCRLITPRSGKVEARISGEGLSRRYQTSIEVNTKPNQTIYTKTDQSVNTKPIHKYQPNQSVNTKPVQFELSLGKPDVKPQ